jgi:hypothetical protein
LTGSRYISGVIHKHRLLPRAATRTGSSNYTFLKTDLTGKPATYDPCHPIEYVINPAGAPADYMSFRSVSRPQHTST